MTSTDTAGNTRARIGNLAVLSALLLVAAWFCTLQGDAPWSPASQHGRWIAALAVVVAYAGFVAWTLWRSRPRDVAQDAANGDAPATLVTWASQTGFAQQLAERTAQSLRDAGLPVRLLPIDKLDAATLAASERALFVASTTGEGDPPDHALGFVRKAMPQADRLHALHYAVLALGDHEYDHFCAFGHQLDDWLRRHGAQPLFDLVEVDNADAGALRHWQHQLGQIGGLTDAPDWTPARYEDWTLAERRELNPGSAGFPAFHVALTPPADARPQWQAGDIAEIRVSESPEISREYSIASLPADGSLQLLLRRMLRPDGTPGIGSGFLCDHAEIGGHVAVRIRANPNFHPPAAERPLILVGNGTGIAGLRALLKARIAAGARRNWLLFGERNRDRDFFFGKEIEAWQRDGLIERLDLAFSRDQAERIHVQHRLRDAADTLRAWVEAGAAIYVCGSLAGMAPAVDAVLRETLGDEEVETLLADGRYRRDVY
ncbi:MAG: sulfite reductase subunit alpha [Pseudoxanthomonas sp.]